jgi:Ca2+-binding RTX toxin-like protein
MSELFRVVLDGSQETPSNDSTATGIGTVIFDSDAVTATYSFRIEGLDFGPITGAPPDTPDNTLDDVTNAHFHNQVLGVAGAIVFGQINPAQDNDDLSILHNGDGSWTVSGRWDLADPANVSIANFADALGSTPIGSDAPLYFNIHTTEFPAGEIRGQLQAIADDNDNVVTGTPVDDLLTGLGGDDVILGLAGNDTIDGGPGNDTLSGGPGDDVITGGAGSDVMLGGDGNDLIQASATTPEAALGGDRLFGDAGNDTVIGGNGADVIDGGPGNDVLTGNGGADTFIFQADATGNDRVTDFNPSEDVVQLAGFAASFDPMAGLSAQAGGTELDLGNGNSVLFEGRTPADFHASDFLVV